MTTQELIRQWLLALRDLCQQGATASSVTLPGGSIMTYSPERGATVIAGGHTLRIGDDWLEHHGFGLSDLGRVAEIQS